MSGDSLETDIEKANAELDQGLKSCRSMLNDYRAALTGEQAMHEGDGASAASIAQWRTQEDSNL